jgi:NitT/TauT family transport system ATP-binding protein
MTRSPSAAAPAGEILAEGISKVYTDIAHRQVVVALRDFSLAIRPREFVAIVGPSGCGKTTFLNIVAGFDRQTEGKIQLDGRPIAGPGPDRGVVFQEYALFPWLSVLGNVTFGLHARGIQKAEAEAEAMKWLGMVHLVDFAGKYPHELSGGMRQRVALVRVLANEPTILLMDEPFAALDALTRTVLQRELQDIWQRTNKTVVFVTHNVDEAIFLADRVVIMSRHHVIKRIVPVDLPRPRDVTSDAFNEYRRLAMRELEDELAPRSDAE